MIFSISKIMKFKKQNEIQMLNEIQNWIQKLIME